MLFDWLARGAISTSSRQISICWTHRCVRTGDVVHAVCVQCKLPTLFAILDLQLNVGRLCDESVDDWRSHIDNGSSRAFVFEESSLVFLAFCVYFIKSGGINSYLHGASRDDPV